MLSEDATLHRLPICVVSSLIHEANVQGFVYRCGLDEPGVTV
jgi:hypothetical protein